MNCSVKFLDPTVISTPLLSGFSWIASALVSPPVSLSSSSSPHAAIPTASTAQAMSANSSFESLLVISGHSLSSLVGSSGPVAAGILCRRGGVLQLDSLRRQQTLEPGEEQLDDEDEDGHQDRARDHALVTVDVAREDKVAEGDDADQRRDGRRGDHVDRRSAHAGHDRRSGERELDL